MSQDLNLKFERKLDLERGEKGKEKKKKRIRTLHGPTHIIRAHPPFHAVRPSLGEFAPTCGPNRAAALSRSFLTLSLALGPTRQHISPAQPTSLVPDLAGPSPQPEPSVRAPSSVGADKWASPRHTLTRRCQPGSVYHRLRSTVDFSLP